MNFHADLLITPSINNYLNLIPEPIFIIDVSTSNYTYKYMNIAGENFIGLNFDQAKNKPIKNIPNLIENITKCAQSNSSIDFTTYINMLDENQFHLITLTPINVKKIVICAIKNITPYANDFKHNFSDSDLSNEILNSVEDCIISTDKNLKITSLNPAVEFFLQEKATSYLGKYLPDILTLISNNKNSPLIPEIYNVLETGHSTGAVYEGREINIKNNIYNIDFTCSAVKNNNNEIQGVVLLFWDSTEKKKQQEKITYLSYNDPLTDLRNRAFLEENLPKYNNENYLPLTIVMGDINGLKFTNDIFGHAYGDLLLKTMSDILKSSFRNQDLIARWGGDEFIIILPNTTKEKALNLCENVDLLCRNSSIEPIKPSISLGVATKTMLTKAM